MSSFSRHRHQANETKIGLLWSHQQQVPICSTDRSQREVQRVSTSGAHDDTSSGFSIMALRNPPT